MYYIFITRIFIAGKMESFTLFIIESESLGVLPVFKDSQILINKIFPEPICDHLQSVSEQENLILDVRRKIIKINKRNKSGPETDPWGTPERI